jgi:hypothetical protein
MCRSEMHNSLPEAEKVWVQPRQCQDSIETLACWPGRPGERLSYGQRALPGMLGAYSDIARK